MSWTLCTSGAAISRAGVNANTDAVTSGGLMDEWSNQAEGRICSECHTNFITNITDYGEISGALQDVAASLIAMNMIAYDMSGYTQGREAETILDVLDDRANKGLQVLKDKKKQRLST